MKWLQSQRCSEGRNDFVMDACPLRPVRIRFTESSGWSVSLYECRRCGVKFNERGQKHYPIKELSDIELPRVNHV